jgi:hypothetical protein
LFQRKAVFLLSKEMSAAARTFIATRLASSNLHSIGLRAARRWMSQDAAASNAAHKAKGAKFFIFKPVRFLFKPVRFLVITGAAATAYCWWDHYTHTNRDYLRKQMRKAIQGGLPDDSLPMQRTKSLPVPPLETTIEKSPMIVMGPPGSGKSTLMGDYARKLKKSGVPVVYIRLRGLDTSGMPIWNSRQTPTSSSALQSLPVPKIQFPPIAEFTMASESFFRAIGYPVRPSWWTRLRIKITRLTGRGIDVDLTSPLARSRFTDAVSDLFAVFSQLARERAENDSIPPEHKSPVIFADELYDLLDEKVAGIGGALVFRRFADSLLAAGVDGVRVIVSGTNPELYSCLSGRSNDGAGGLRLNSFYTTDPTPDAVLKGLSEVGYPEAVAKQILEECGTRLRILADFLEVKLDKDGKVCSPFSGKPIDIRVKLKSVADGAARDIIFLFGRTEMSDNHRREQLVTFLDELVASSPGAPPVGDRQLLVTSPSARAVIFRDGCTGACRFQSEAHKLAWKRLRNRYSSRSLKSSLVDFFSAMVRL